MSNMIVSPEPILWRKARKFCRLEGKPQIDAAVQCTFVQGVVNPHMCGVGGYVLLNLRLASGQLGHL